MVFFPIFFTDIPQLFHKVAEKTYFSNILQIFCKPENNFINRIAGTYNNLQELAAKAKKAGGLSLNSKHRNLGKKNGTPIGN
ncbi:MAG: hypothetical protein IKA65_07920, partial [Lentisphaeria bacterium]|nr:hypothetical protein [Lentisphaeria bacterium]